MTSDEPSPDASVRGGWLSALRGPGERASERDTWESEMPAWVLEAAIAVLAIALGCGTRLADRGVSRSNLTRFECPVCVPNSRQKRALGAAGEWSGLGLVAVESAAQRAGKCPNSVRYGAT